MKLIDDITLAAIFLFLIFMLAKACEARADYIDTYEQILSNRPNIDRIYAKELAATIDKYGKEYGVSTQAFVAILMLESAYRLNAYNKKTKDYGIAQISEYNVKALKLDRGRLMSDLDYSIRWGMDIYYWFYKRYPLNEAIRRYNCGTRRTCIFKKESNNYLRLVLKYM